MLERHAALTPFGASILAELASAVEQVRAVAVDPDGVPAYVALEATGGFEREHAADGRALSVCDAVSEHLARHG